MVTGNEDKSKKNLKASEVCFKTFIWKKMEGRFGFLLIHMEEWVYMKKL